MLFSPDFSTVIRGAPRLDAGAPRLVAGTPRPLASATRLVAGAPWLDAGAPTCSQACRRRSQAYPGRSQVLPGASKVLSSAPRYSQTYHHHSHGTPVAVIRDPSYSEGRLECPPRVWYSPEIDSSKFTFHILSDTPGVFQWLKYILLMSCDYLFSNRNISRHLVSQCVSQLYYCLTVIWLYGDCSRDINQWPTNILAMWTMTHRAYSEAYKLKPTSSYASGLWSWANVTDPWETTCIHFDN